MMTSPNPHLGSTFESWLEETGLLEDVSAAAVKTVMAAAEEEKKRRQAEAAEPPSA